MYSNIKQRIKRLKSVSIALLFIVAYSVSALTSFVAAPVAGAASFNSGGQNSSQDSSEGKDNQQNKQGYNKDENSQGNQVGKNNQNDSQGSSAEDKKSDPKSKDNGNQDTRNSKGDNSSQDDKSGKKNAEGDNGHKEGDVSKGDKEGNSSPSNKNKENKQGDNKDENSHDDKSNGQNQAKDGNKDDKNKHDNCERDCSDDQRPKPTKVVDAIAPTWNDGCGTSSDTYTIPDVEGVQYFVNGNPVAHGTYPTNGESVVVTAKALPCYRLDVESKHCWSHEFSDELCAVEASVPVDPSVVCGPNNDVVTVPSNTSHVTYTSTGWVNGKNTVTVTVAPGYYIAGTQGLTTQSWTYTDLNTSCGQVLGDSTTTPNVLAATTTLENTGTSLTLPMLLSTGVIGLAFMTIAQSSTRKSKLTTLLQRAAESMARALSQPFVLPA